MIARSLPKSLPKSLSAVLVAAASLLAGCSSPGLAESWIDPSVQSLSGYDKVFVAYLGTDAAVQRVAEDAMAEHIHAAEVVRCYSLFPDTRELDAEKVKAKLREQGFDAAVVMRAAGVEQRVSESPGSYPPAYSSFGTYWGWAHPYASAPASLHVDEVVHVETNVYSLAGDKLLYAARSETFNPDSTAELVDEIAGEIGADLEKKGVLRPESPPR